MKLYKITFDTGGYCDYFVVAAYSALEAAKLVVETHTGDDRDFSMAEVYSEFLGMGPGHKIRIILGSFDNDCNS